MLEESIRLLDPKPGATFLDCTVGGGGHARALAERLAPGGTLVGIDLDPDALEAAAKALAPWEGRLKVLLQHGNYRRLREFLSRLGIEGLDGCIFDLGVSSPQLDRAERGFSYHLNAPLDMRMDKGQGKSAAVLLNTLSEKDLTDLIFRYGEERWSRRIAAGITAWRARKPLATTGELVEVIRNAVPPQARREGHPARRTFQALRIAVNDELVGVEEGLKGALDLLKPGGRVAVITFHSLEDRLVKNLFQSLSRSCRCPAGQPICTCSGKKELEVLTKKPVLPREEEVDRNPRARSAKLRAARKAGPENV